jgi:hypothetical protein
MAGTSPAMTTELPSLRGAEATKQSNPVMMRSLAARANFFIIFVDLIFTTLFERPFTKVFDVPGANSAFSCLYRARNAD